MALFVAVVFGAVLLWLKAYTNHGQKLELKNYIGINYKKAAKDAAKQSFELIVKDSIHKVGQPGGLIIAQNPKGGSTVKENRKIYVDITKYRPDEIALESLSDMYGRNFESKKNELSYLDINSKIKGYEQDSGEPDHILQVWYEGKMIAGRNGRKKGIKIKKGGTLEFVLSKQDGGQVNLPDLVCKQYGELAFLLGVYKLKLGAVEHQGAITNRESAYVISQFPPFSEGKTVNMGDMLEVTIQQQQPESCKN